MKKELIELMTAKLTELMTPETKRLRFNPLDKRLFITQPYKQLSKVV